VPDHYRLSVRQAGQLAAAQNSCTQPSTDPGAGFTFIGQPFGWAAVPQVTLTAEDAANNVTRNWTGSLQRLVPAAV
jgi:hypothetical protein